MPNFSDFLDRRADEVERPKPLPVGTYRTVIKGQPRFDKSTKKGTEFVEFTHTIVEAADDVDEDALKEYLGDDKLRGKEIKNVYYLTENSLWRVKEFLEHCGLDVEGKHTLGQLIEGTPNCEVYLTIRHEPSQDGQAMFARVGGSAAVE